MGGFRLVQLKAILVVMLMVTIQRPRLVGIRVGVGVGHIIFVLGVGRALCDVSDEDFLGKRRCSEV